MPDAVRLAGPMQVTRPWEKLEGVAVLRTMLTRPVSAHRVSLPYVLLTFVALFWGGKVVLGRAIAGRIPRLTSNHLRWLIALGVAAARVATVARRGHGRPPAPRSP